MPTLEERVAQLETRQGLIIGRLVKTKKLVAKILYRLGALHASGEFTGIVHQDQTLDTIAGAPEDPTSPIPSSEAGDL